MDECGAWDERCVWIGVAWFGKGGGDWMRGLDLGFTNPVGTGVVCWMCVCLGCGGVGGEWVEGLNQGLEGWGCVCASPDSRYI